MAYTTDDTQKETWHASNEINPGESKARKHRVEPCIQLDDSLLAEMYNGM